MAGLSGIVNRTIRGLRRDNIPSGYVLGRMPGQTDGPVQLISIASLLASGQVQGKAGGDLSGSYPNPSVVKLQGNAVKSAAPNDGDLLQWVTANSEWEPKPGLDVTDGTTDVKPVTKLKFTSGATVSSAGGGECDIAISGGGGGSSVSSWYDGAAVPLSAPSASSFTLTQNTNQGGTATLTNLASRGMVLTQPCTSTSGDNVCTATVAKPGSTDYTVTACILAHGLLQPNAGGYGGGICFVDNAGKIIAWGFRNGTGAIAWRSQWTTINALSSSSNLITPTNYSFGAPMWWRVAKSGSNFIFSCSFDGENFVTVDTQSTTGFIGSTVSSVGLLWDNNCRSAPNTNFLDVFSFTAA